MVVDNPYFGKMWVPTLDGDEPLDLLDIPSIAIAGPQLGYGKGHLLTLGGGVESRPRDAFWRDKYKSPPGLPVKAGVPKPKKKKHDLHALGF